ncbi:hypothetical protein LCGC14_1893420, partial [marine sediment metagenome]
PNPKDISDVLFFAAIDGEGIDSSDINSLSSMIKGDVNANYDGMRIIRNEDHFPTSVVDGDLINDGFVHISMSDKEWSVQIALGTAPVYRSYLIPREVA